MSILFAIAATAQQAPALPDFQFGIHNTTGNYSRENLEAIGCDEESARVFVCETLETFAGARMVFVFTVVDSRLSRIFVGGLRDALPGMMDALRERYGAPCQIESRTVTTGVGREVESARITWCFRTGNLVLDERAGRLDQFALVYQDEANPLPTRRISPGF